MDRGSSTPHEVEKLKECLIAALLFAATATAQAQEPERDLGMNIIGNNETPRTLIIVPWKSAQPGDLTLRPLNSLVESSIGPLDPDVVRRELRLRASVQQRAEPLK